MRNIVKNIVKIYLLSALSWLIITSLITSCYYEGNKVSLSAEDASAGECVNAYYPAYEALPYDIAAQGKVGPLHSDGFLQNFNMPSKSPLCISMTITNNNHGQNSNNIVIIGKGLEIEYNLDGQDISNSVYDPKASDVNIEKFSQNSGILSVFDPENCLTTQGKHVRLLKDNFHSCKFFLQISDTKYHIIKDNKINLKLNYSNGDEIYQAIREIKYYPKIFLGAESSPLSKISDLNDKFTTWSHNQTDEAALFVVSDNLGDIYTFTKENLYIYQGNHLLYSDKIVLQPSNIFSDQSGNVYVTNGQELYVLNIALYKLGQNMLAMKSNLPGEISSIQDIAQYKNNVYLLVNNNKIYKAQEHNWILWFDGDNYSDLKDKRINKFYFNNDKSIFLAVDKGLYQYIFSDNKTSNMLINGTPSYQNINQILNFNDEIYVAYNNNLPKNMSSLLYKHSSVSDYFEPIANLKATTLNGILELPGQKTLCMYGKDLYDTEENNLSRSRRYIYNTRAVNTSAVSNFICVTDDKMVTTINGATGMVNSAVGYGSFEQ